DEAVPDRLRSVDRAMRCDAELLRALFDVVALLGRNAAGVGEHGVHGVAALLQIRHAEARVESARKREHDVLAHFASPLTSAAMIAFCTWRRFSASSTAMHASESMTASVALTFRRSGRQWLNNAPFVSAILRSSTMKSR